MKISVAIPKMSGGGAETFTRQFAIWLRSRGLLSRVYTAHVDPHFEENSFPLGELRAAGALRPFWRGILDDYADSYLLTLGYINLSVCLALRKPKAKVVIRICNPPSEEVKLLSRGRAIRYWVSTWFSCAIADRIIVQSEHMRWSMVSTKLAAESKICVIHNPVNKAVWSLRNTERVLKFPYILCASSNKPQKDLPTLISAFAKIQNKTDRHLVLAGVDPHDYKILDCIEEHGADPRRVHCLGFVDNVYPLIEHADLCALSSVFEGFSNFLLEAASYGKKIVATDCPGGNVDLFSRYPNHEIVPVRDTDALSIALLAKKEDLSIEASKSFLKDFNSGHIFSKYLQVLEKL